jgi:hypothetical protein
MKNFKSFLMFAFCSFLFALPLYADGLSTPFIDVQVVGVKVGKPFTVTHSSAEGLLLQNVGSSAVRVRVEVFPPSATDLKGGAVPIPDVNWVSIEPPVLDIPPQGRALCRIQLKVPPQNRYRRKYYQAMIWSRTEPRSGQAVSIGAGLISRLRFKTD